jgi:tetratricopeptide (TPR) repeat protein
MMRIKCWLLLVLLAGLLSFVLENQAQTKPQDKGKLHFDRARDAELLNDPQAEKEYRLAIEARNDLYPDAFLHLSFYLAGQLRFSEAVVVFREYIRQTPNEDHTGHPEKLKDLQRGAILQEHIEKTDRPELSDLLDLASLVLRYGRYGPKQSVPYAEKATELYPTSSEAHLLLARSLVGSAHQTRRLQLLKKAVELDPSNPRAHNQFGWYYLERVRGLEAAEEFRKALELSNEALTDSWQGLGHALVLQGKNKEAIGAFNRYLESGDVPKSYERVLREEIKRLQTKGSSR